VRHGQAGGHGAEAGADGGDVKVRHGRDGCGKHDGEQDARPAGAEPLQGEDHSHRACCDDEGMPVCCGRGGGEHGQLFEERPRLCPGELQAEQVFQLAGANDDRDARREADRHRIGHELHERAEPEPARQRQHHAGQKDGEDQPVHTMGRGGHVDQNDEGAGGSADLEPAAAQQRNEEAANDRRDQALRRACARGNGDGDGERQRHDGDGEAGNCVGPELRKAVALAQHRDELWRVEIREARRRGRRLLTERCHG